MSDNQNSDDRPSSTDAAPQTGYDTTGTTNDEHKTNTKSVSPTKINFQCVDGNTESASFGLNVDILGESESIQRTVAKQDFDQYEILIEFDEPVSLSDLIGIFNFQIEEGKAANIQINFDKSQSINSFMSRYLENSYRDKKYIKNKSAKSLKDFPKKDSEIPDPPEVDSIDGKINKEFYDRMMEGNDDQPNTIRRLIYKAREISKDELATQIEKKGYSKSSSGFATTLRVLEKIGEIEREGDGGSQNIIWIGNQK